MSPTGTKTFSYWKWLVGGSRLGDVSWVISGALDVDPLKKIKKFPDKVKNTPPSAPSLSRQPEGLLYNKYFTKSWAERGLVVVYLKSLQNLFHYKEKLMCINQFDLYPVDRIFRMLGKSVMFKLVMVPEKDNEDLQSDGGVGRKAAIPEDKKAGSLQWCTQTWGSLAGHVKPELLVNREWETLWCDVEWEILMVITDSPKRNTTKKSLTQSIKLD